MTIFTTTCPACGDVTLRPADVRLVLCPHAASFLFACPGCGVTVTKPAPDEIQLLLISGGVRPIRVPVQQHAGPRLTADDLLDFALHLGDTDLLAGELL